eukprot:CAMPEP_0119323976 /NCGR_PEP_ID=MMETSP1333-20130426/62092_1 /TAXON_ID=418940 /ORGANISM="Scyphosphaera apsteinii, Strain RCC1455" /LENGTH=85 /DNA_ID=CAMNT_0007331565 /DNA_START=34 /DNA_END=291 /DNA_ORIENTATION=+
MALAPDLDGGRRLAAAFTAQDALQLFVASSAATPQQELFSAEVTGMELFAHLGSADVEGIVFNPAGPGQPIPFLRAIADTILNEE